MADIDGSHRSPERRDSLLDRACNIGFVLLLSGM